MDLNESQLLGVRVRSVTDCSGLRRVGRRFSVDPRSVTLRRLRHLVARALDLHGDFSLHLADREEAVSSDWDLEAILAEATDIELDLRIRPHEPGLEEWDVICPGDVPVAGHEALTHADARGRSSSFLEQVLGFGRSRRPLSESQFRSLEEWPRPLRHAVFRAGGADPETRPALWLHLLDVYPAAAGPRQREAFLDRKAQEYYALRHAWQRNQEQAPGADRLRELVSQVARDVRRTDRPLLCAEERRALRNLLVTYALCHPSLPYRQGMGDLLSPLLHVLRTEARAYAAFCALMTRLRTNFAADSRSVRLKLRHLGWALAAHDPAMHAHLEAIGAGEMLFCYRWLLLDLKREFPFGEALTFAEVLWSTLTPRPNDDGVRLREDTTTHSSTTPPLLRSFLARTKEDEERRRPLEEEDSTKEREAAEGERRRVLRRRRSRSSCAGDVPERERVRHGSGEDSNYGSTTASCAEEEESDEDGRSRSEGYASDSSLRRTVTDEEDEDGVFGKRGDVPRRRRLLLPPPTRLGDGRPFLVFSCLALLLSNRGAVMGAGDAAEVGAHFDRRMRAHSLPRLLPLATRLFLDYLRAGWTDDDDD